MGFTRRQFMLAATATSVGGPTLLTACSSGGSDPAAGGSTTIPAASGPLPAPGSAGLLDEEAFQARATDYFEFATAELQPGNETNIVAHLMRAERDDAFTWDPSEVTVETLSGTWEMLDEWKDTGDFRMMYLHWMLHLGDDILDDEVITEIERQLVNFRYRYDDPLPDDRLDHKWFWSENHQVIFAVIEFLAGQRLPDATFEVTGLTGAEHRDRARPVILEWIDERARYGFSEWHSNVYMTKNITPLVTVLELSDDEEIVTLAAGAIDVCLADIALNVHNGLYGASRGRTYKKDKMSARDEATYGTAKLLFDDTDGPWVSTSDTGATYLAGAKKYRLPEVVVRIATSDDVVTIKERHGVPIDPHEPFTEDPVAAYGYDYDDDANLTFWWGQGALTAWQLVPATLRAAEEFRLWDTDLFKEYDAIRTVADAGPVVAQQAALSLASMAAFGVLSEAHTYTWRSPDVMLSSVIDHRAGDGRDQAHAWQATLGLDTMVFTTHPQNETPQSTNWRDDDGYWTGSASMPRSAQHENVAVHLYSPAYDSPTDDLLGPVFGYLEETHAYFPQEHFDEVVEQDGWTFGRLGDGYVALWSFVPTTWREYDPEVVATNGMEQPFDLVAEGSANNVWVVEVGRAADHGSFEEFVDAVAAASVSAEMTDAGPSVTYTSPSVGEVGFSWEGAFTVDGADVAIADHPRLSSPWGDVDHLDPTFTLADGDAALEIDFESGTRSVS